MKLGEVFRRVATLVQSTVRSVFREEFRSPYTGEVFFIIRDSTTGEILDQRHVKNLIVKDASILVARLMRDNAEPPKSIYVLAVGTGDVGWNPMTPPAPTNTQRALFSELTRKTFSETYFVDAAGAPTSIPTNVVDYKTTFSESEAVGPLVEMGLLGGNISTNMSVRNPVSPPNGSYDPTVDLTTRETMINYLTFPVINKPATSTLEIVWRITY